MSEDMNEWDDTSRVGAIIGFVVFGLAVLYTIYRIFDDIAASAVEYEKLIENDLKVLTQDLKVSGPRMAELEKELQIRLSGVKEDHIVDD